MSSEPNLCPLMAPADPMTQKTCHDVLVEHDAYAELLEGNRYATVRDCDGGFLFAVEPDITPHTLSTIFHYARKCFKQGEVCGRDQQQRAMRAVLGINE